ncbi:hypothetical protein GCM10009846_10460 [Agrococcus versicolor]|uniref:Flp pilus-assembly TadG-like N-terminal domain-containing protein n=1 Tax=Agrococcus versicolor TaxID=501482 RepID=A0ABN3AMV1_9MICO
MIGAMGGRRARSLLRDEEGSTLLLTIAYGALALALVVVVVAATSLLIERRRLLTLADGAALHAAEAFALSQVAFDGVQPSPRLADEAVEEAAQAWLRAAPTDLDAVRLVAARSLDGQTAEVSVAAAWRPPIVSVLLPDGVPLDVTVTARSVFVG